MSFISLFLVLSRRAQGHGSYTRQTDPVMYRRGGYEEAGGGGGGGGGGTKSED